MANLFVKEKLIIQSKYCGLAERNIIRYCAENKLVISRPNLETCTLNLHAHMKVIEMDTCATAEGEPLGLPSAPASPPVCVDLLCDEVLQDVSSPESITIESD